jgi:serine phosphatase RsbU (regulator of sigma subunit)/tetratricopeptide (TPR) repeat protein
VLPKIFALLLAVLLSFDCFAQTLADSVKVKEMTDFAKKNYNKAGLLEESSQKAHEALLISRKIRYKKGELQALLALEAVESFKNNQEEALAYAEKVINMATEAAFRGELAHAYYAKAYIGYLQGRHNDALELYEKSKEIRLQIKDFSGAATCMNSIGNIYNTKGDYEKSVQNYLKAAELRESENDLFGLAAIYNNLGNVYFGMGYTEQALEYFKKSLELKQKVGDKKGISGSMLNISTVYKRMKKFDLSLKYQSEALRMQEELNDLRGLAVNLNNFGTYYSQLPNYDSALYFYRKSLKIREQIKEVNGKIITQLGIGNVFMKLNVLDSTYFYLNAAMEAAEKNGANKELRDANRLLSDYFYLKEDFKSALESYRKFVLIKDSIISDDRTAQINKLQESFTKLRSEKENEILRKENALKQAELERKVLNESQLRLQAEQEKQKSLLLLSENKIKESELKNAQLENDKREKELNLLTEQKRLKEKELELSEKAVKFQQYFVLAAVALIVFSMTSVVYFRKSRNRLFKKNEEIVAKNLEITSQKEIIEAIADNLKDAYAMISVKNKLIEEKNQNMTASITYAKRIQSAILPDTTPVAKFSKDYAFWLSPRDIVSGDFYWLNEVQENGQNNLILAVTDCTGHGVPGAFMSMIGNDLLNAIIIEKKIFSPEKIALELDNEIRKVLRQDETNTRDGMDIAVCKIIPNERVIEFCGAKQPIFYIDAEGNENYLKGSKRAVGGMDIMRNIKFEKQIIPYKSGFTFYLYSDGFQDQFGGEYPFSKYKSKPFREMLKRHSHLSFAEQKERWQKELAEFMSENPVQTDDILIFGAKM